MFTGTRYRGTAFLVLRQMYRVSEAREVINRAYEMEILRERVSDLKDSVIDHLYESRFHANQEEQQAAMDAATILSAAL